MSVPVVGLYVHVPFCIKTCPYCAFYKMPYNKELSILFVENLLIEMKQYRDRYGVIDVDTIFFGGGTPNVLSKQQMTVIMEGIHSNFNVFSTVEFSMEMNPGIHSKSKLQFYKEVGVNRVSIGAQSFHQAVLDDYGRNHSVADTMAFIHQVFDSGFENVSVDVIFGHSNHSMDHVITSLQCVGDLKIPHVALYGLTILEGTPFHQAGVSVDDDVQGEQYCLIQDHLAKQGYIQYEVSNFSLEGFQCRHNVKYWTLQPTIGLGAGAHSYFNGVRYENDLDLEHYLCSLPNKLPPLVVLPPNWNDFISVRLRYFFSIYFEEIDRTYNMCFFELYKKPLQELDRNGFIELSSDSFVVTQKGISVLDEVTCYLLN